MHLTNVALQENSEQSSLQSQHQSLELYTACSLLMWVGVIINLWSWFYYHSSIPQGWFAEHFSYYTWTGSAGLSFLQFCNLNSFRTKFVLGFSVFMGLSVPQYFNEYTVVNGYGPVHTGARWVHTYMASSSSSFPSLCQVIEGFNQISLFFCQFNDMINVPFSSEPFVAGLLALFLDFTLHQKDSQTRRDRGMHWWDRFRSFKTDTRSEEFYSLPFNLNKFFPSVWFLGNVALKLCDPSYVLLLYILLWASHPVTRIAFLLP